jgi:hypothetical protein
MLTAYFWVAWRSLNEGGSVGPEERHEAVEWAISDQKTDGVVIRGSPVLHSMVSVSVSFDNFEVHEHLRASCWDSTMGKSHG